LYCSLEEYARVLRLEYAQSLKYQKAQFESSFEKLKHLSSTPAISEGDYRSGIFGCAAEAQRHIGPKNTHFGELQIYGKGSPDCREEKL
jgi:hypothetical protein